LRNLFKLLGLLWMSNSVFAGVTQMGPQHQQTHTKLVSTSYGFQQNPQLELSVLLGGSYIPNTINGQTLQLLPYEIGPNADTFTAQRGAGAFTWGIDAKYRFKLHKSGPQSYFFDAIGAGINIFQIIDFNQTGHVLQFNLPEFENYTYKLKLKNTRVMADFDLDFHPLLFNLIPFVEGGIGAANTQITYDSAPIPPLDSPNFQLPQKSSWHFAYQVGAGMKYTVNTHFLLSIHYLYADMGKVDSSTSGNTTTLATPLSAEMRTHNFMIGVTYLIK
jgi:opacity protein-like surface antigen